jgi:hypothetical protein
VLERGCSYPDIFDPDRFALRFEPSQKISCPHRFRFTE